MSDLAPIALFVYNRPEHTRRTLDALSRNREFAETEVHVFADGPPKGTSAEEVERIEEVRDLLRERQWSATVELHEANENLGLANSLITGISTVVNKHGRVIVLEDDLEVSQGFLRWMNEGLDLYEGESDVASLHGYCYPVGDHLPPSFFLRGADCWGWATWARAWSRFNPNSSELLARINASGETHLFDMGVPGLYTGMLEANIRGDNDSWAIRWYASAFLEEKLTLYPGRSLVRNIGLDASGRHCGTDQRFETVVDHDPPNLRRIPVAESDAARDAFSAFLGCHQAPTPHGPASFSNRLRQWLARTLSK